MIVQILHVKIEDLSSSFILDAHGLYRSPFHRHGSRQGFRKYMLESSYAKVQPRNGIPIGGRAQHELIIARQRLISLTGLTTLSSGMTGATHHHSHRLPHSETCRARILTGACRMEVVGGPSSLGLGVASCMGNVTALRISAIPL